MNQANPYRKPEVKPETPEQAEPGLIDSLNQTWQKYGPYIAFAVSAIVVISVLVVLQNRWDEQALANAYQLASSSSVSTTQLEEELAEYEGTAGEPLLKYRLGTALLQDNQPDKALKQFEEVTSKWPNTVFAEWARHAADGARKNASWTGQRDQRLNELQAEHDAAAALYLPKEETPENSGEENGEEAGDAEEKPAAPPADEATPEDDGTEENGSATNEGDTPPAEDATEAPE